MFEPPIIDPVALHKDPIRPTADLPTGLYWWRREQWPKSVVTLVNVTKTFPDGVKATFIQPDSLGETSQLLLDLAYVQDVWLFPVSNDALRRMLALYIKESANNAADRWLGQMFMTVN